MKMRSIKENLRQTLGIGALVVTIPLAVALGNPENVDDQRDNLRPVISVVTEMYDLTKETAKNYIDDVFFNNRDSKKYEGANFISLNKSEGGRK